MSVIKWLRGLSDQDAAVNLTWERKGHLTLTQRNAADASAVMRAPVEIEGAPPLIAFARATWRTAWKSAAPYA